MGKYHPYFHKLSLLNMDIHIHLYNINLSKISNKIKIKQMIKILNKLQINL
jgi:hypothetical protein